jgi:hypothetical protein
MGNILNDQSHQKFLIVQHFNKTKRIQVGCLLCEQKIVWCYEVVAEVFF